MNLQESPMASGDNLSRWVQSSLRVLGHFSLSASIVYLAQSMIITKNVRQRYLLIVPLSSASIATFLLNKDNVDKVPIDSEHASIRHLNR